MYAKDSFMRYLDKIGVSYEDKGDTSIELVFEADNNDDGVSCFVSFIQVDELMNISITSFDFTDISGPRSALLEKCNEATNGAGIARFYLDGDGDVLADLVIPYADATFDTEHLYHAVKYFASDVDEAYLIF